MKRLLRSAATALGIAALMMALGSATPPAPALASAPLTVGCNATSKPDIQTAVNAAPNAPKAAGTITVCPGTYTLTTPILITGKTRLKLIGKNKPSAPVILQVEAAPATPFAGSMIDVSNSTRVTIQGFVFFFLIILGTL